LEDRLAALEGGELFRRSSRQRLAERGGDAFGDQGVDLGLTGASALTITNVGGAPLAIASVALAGADPGEFVITSDSGDTSLAFGVSRLVMVAFDPSSVGEKFATLNVVSDDTDEASIDVALSGTGTDDPPENAAQHWTIYE